MGRKTIVQLTDDLDGSDATSTVRFSWNGVGYEIDLNTAHAEAFAAAIGPYLVAARRISSPRRAQRTPARRAASPAPRGGPAEADAADLAAIRNWAADNGLQVAARGRIPHRILDAYRAARRTAAAPADAAPPAPPAKPTPTAKKTAAKKAPARRATAKKAAGKRTSAKKTAGQRAPRAAASKSVASKRGGARKRPATRADSPSTRS